MRREKLILKELRLSQNEGAFSHVWMKFNPKGSGKRGAGFGSLSKDIEGQEAMFNSSHFLSDAGSDIGLDQELGSLVFALDIPGYEINTPSKRVGHSSTSEYNTWFMTFRLFKKGRKMKNTNDWDLRIEVVFKVDIWGAVVFELNIFDQLPRTTHGYEGSSKRNQFARRVIPFGQVSGKTSLALKRSFIKIVKDFKQKFLGMTSRIIMKRLTQK